MNRGVNIIAREACVITLERCNNSKCPAGKAHLIINIDGNRCMDIYGNDESLVVVDTFTERDTKPSLSNDEIGELLRNQNDG